MKTDIKLVLFLERQEKKSRWPMGVPQLVGTCPQVNANSSRLPGLAALTPLSM